MVAIVFGDQDIKGEVRKGHLFKIINFSSSAYIR